MIVRAVNERRAGLTQADAASRIALAARSASSEDAAVDAVRRVLEEILT
jgi:hypothetical protein